MFKLSKSKKEIDQARLPAHVALFMDGNGRWASKRLLPRLAGHRAGSQTIKKLAHEADKLGLRFMTVYAFSTENWSRSQEEVSGLMSLLRDSIREYINEAKDNNIRVLSIGELSRLPEDLQTEIAELKEITKNKTGLTLIIAMNYGGRDEILRAVNKLIQSGEKNIDVKTFESMLDTNGVPDPDLVIRTSGEQRLSNFLLWQLSYSELYFTKTLWPDFTISDLKEAVVEYQSRNRRYGGR